MVFIYAIIGIPNSISKIHFIQEFQNIISNVCTNPDDDIVSNVIGFFRNFIAKSKN
jgi:hypothetical protein